MQQFFLRLFCVLVFVGSIASNVLQAQVGIGVAAPDGTAMLDVSSITRGLLPPRMTAAQRTGIVNPATGLVVFQTDAPVGLYVQTGPPATPSWQQLGTAGVGITLGVALASPQGITRTGGLYLYNIEYNANNGAAAGARINSLANGGGNNAATALTLITQSTGNATATGASIAATGAAGGTATGLTVNATGGTNNYAALFTAGNVGIGVPTPAALLGIGAGTAARSSLNIATGVAPGTPATGDIWVDATGNLFYKPTGAAVNLSAGGTDANTTLSNLGVTAINANLNFAAGANRIIGIASPAVTGAGNSITLQAAAANTDGVGGAVNITAGNANSTGAAVSGGSVNITGGNAATGPGGGGSIVLTGGNDGSGSNAAGSIVMVPGTAVGVGRQGGVAIGSGVSVGPADFMVIRPSYTPEGSSTYMVQIDPSTTTVNGANFGVALRVSGAFAGSATAKYAAAFENGGVGIGNVNPTLGLDISTGIGVRPGTVAAGATITIPANTSAFAITDDAASAANAITVTGPQNGQLLTIFNSDAQAATLGGLTVPAPSGGNPGVSTFAFISGAWRLVSTNGASGGGVGWTNPAGFVNLSTTTDNVGIGVAATTNNKLTIENATVAMGTAGVAYTGLRNRLITASTTVAGDTLVGQRNIVRIGAGVGTAAANYHNLTHAGAGSMAAIYAVMNTPNGAGMTGTVYDMTGAGASSSTGMNVSITRGLGTGGAQGYSVDLNNSGGGAAVLYQGSINGSSTGGSTYRGLDVFVGGEADATTNTAGIFNISTANPSGTNVGLDVTVSSAGTNYAATFQGGNVGIGTGTPGATLDVDGDFAIRRGSTSIPIIAPGPTNNLAIGTRSFVYLTSGTGGLHQVSGFANGTEGKVLIVRNNTAGGTVEILHNNASSAANNRIWIPSATAVTLAGGQMAIFIYDVNFALGPRWLFVTRSFE